MDRTRQYMLMLARTGTLAFVEEPPADGGGNGGTPPEGESEEKDPGAKEEEENEEPEGFDALDPKTQDEIKSLRKEAGRYRTANKELTKQLAEAKSQADIDAAVAQHQGRISELEVELAMKTHTSGFTPEQLALVDGDTPEKIEEQANRIRAAFAAMADHEQHDDPGADGGMRPGVEDTSALSPRELAERTRARAGRRR